MTTLSAARTAPSATPAATSADAATADLRPQRGLSDRLAQYSRFVALPHTAFALPFALVGAVFASYTYPVRWSQLLWIVVAFTAARFAAMAFNRLIDRGFDAENPRTRDRELPSGRMRVGEARLLVLVACATFVLAAAMLNPLCLALSPVALLAVLGYSYFKRFTAWTHLALGLADGIAPVAGYVAISGVWSDPWTLLPVLALAVMFWVGGFDILYSMQDIEVDRKLGLYSIPSRFGLRAARRVSIGFHVVTLLCLGLAGALVPGVGPLYGVALLATAVLLGLEHGLVDARSPQRLNQAFFTVNVWLSTTFTILVLADRLI